MPIVSKAEFARLAGVTPSAISEAIHARLVVPAGPGRRDGIDPDVDRNRSYLSYPDHQRHDGSWRRRLREGRADQDARATVPPIVQGEPAYFAWWVRRLIRGAFAEGDGTILFFTRHGGGIPVFKKIVKAVHRAKDDEHAAAAVEKILAAVADDAESELKKMEALFLRFGEEDDEDLRRELDQILYEGEDGRRFDEEDEPEEQQATPADPEKEV